MQLLLCGARILEAEGEASNPMRTEKLSAKKTGFVVLNVEAKRVLKAQLPGGGPVVHDVMRDLGVGCTAGRLRRVQTMRAGERKQPRKQESCTH